jgi:hypothetical protein
MKNTNTTTKDNELQFAQVLRADNRELIKMYMKGTNKFALREMRARGLY